MTDKELLYIKTIADEGSITRAAELLHIAQPSLSQTLRRIERQLECQLFLRRKNGVELTEAGRCLYSAACEMLRIYSAALEKLSTLRGGRAVRVGASWYNTTLVLTAAVTEFGRCFPGADVKLIEKNTAQLLELLKSGELDLCLTHEYPAEYPSRSDPRLEVTPLFREAFCAVAHESLGLDRHVLCSRDGTGELVVRALSGLPAIAFSEGQRIRHITDFVLARAGVKPGKAPTTYGFPSALGLAAQGAGFVLLPELYARRELGRGYEKVRQYRLPADCAAYWTAAVCVRKAEILPDLVKTFISILKRCDPYA
ncbi:MAG: LysR family transcriptional regulator [Pyramidobacter sp.]|nr:LysR family transcriptional regulator [Pyramidobacter sp.]